MVQTVGALSFRRAAVDIGANDAFLNSLDNVGASVALSGGDRKSSVGHTFESDKPIIKGGKLDPIDITIRFLYTIVGSEGFEAARAIYETEGGVCYVQWSPGGRAIGQALYQSSLVGDAVGPGVMVGFLYPQGDVESNELIMGQIVIRMACIFTTAREA